MKQRILLILCLTLGLGLSNAQDVIVFRNSEEVQVKIKEITPTTISYVKWSNLNGPNYTIAKSDVWFIKYENGEEEIINPIRASKKHKNITKEESSDSIHSKKSYLTPSSMYIAGVSVGYVSQYHHYNSYANASYESTLNIGLEILPDFKYGIGLRTGALFDFGFVYVKSPLWHEPIFNNYWKKSFGINVPLHLSYRFEIVKDFSLFLRTGPTFNFTIAVWNNNFNEGLLRRDFFDCLWAISGGVRYKMFQLSVGGEVGLTTNNSKIRLNKPIVLSFSVLFGKVGRKKQ